MKQGEPLSPLLFILFVNDDLADFLQGSSLKEELLTVDQTQIVLLLFADETLLLSEAKQGLQNSLDNIYQYCTRWNVTVKTDKTKVMIFKMGSRLDRSDFFYNNVRFGNR